MRLGRWDDMDDRNPVDIERAAAPGPDAAAPATTGLPARAAELTIVVPTFNERANVPPLIERLRTALAGVDWEVIFVDDDSPDGTAALAKAIGASDARVRCLRRIGRRGLAGACLEGMLASQASLVAVMDGDLQHDEALLEPMLARLRLRDVDLLVATRYANGGSLWRRPHQTSPGNGTHGSDERLFH